MIIDREHVEEAVARGTISREQAEALLEEAAARRPRAPLPAHTLPPAVAALVSVLAIGAVQVAAAFLLGQHPSGAQRCLLAAATGFVLLATGVVADGRLVRPLRGWAYLAALVAFRLGVAGVGGEGVATSLLHLWVDAWLLTAAVVLRRPLFALVGALGAGASVGALGELAGVNGLALGVVLGLLAAGLGAAYLRHEEELERLVALRLPGWLRHQLPDERGL
jgi:hypothetical protein